MTKKKLPFARWQLPIALLAEMDGFQPTTGSIESIGKPATVGFGSREDGELEFCVIQEAVLRFFS